MGNGGQKIVSGKATEIGSREVLIDGRMYDVTNLKHPRGTVINFYAGKGIDATEAFQNFHLRSMKAKKILEHLPSRAVSEKKEALPGQSALMADFDALTRELEAEGFFKPAPLHVMYRIAEVVVMHIAALWLIFNNHLALGVILLGVASGRCGWLMHEAGHYSLTGNITVDRTLLIWINGLGCGMSGSWWRSQHNRHHSMPQKLGHDVDLQTLPLVAFTEKVVKKIGVSMKMWLRMQAYLFPIITTSLVALGWQFYVHPRYVIYKQNYAEMAVMTLRMVLWTVLFTFRFGLVNSILLYLAQNWVASNHTFLNFAVSHTHLDVVPQDDTSVDWVRYSAIYTMNVHPGPFKFVSWWMSYLNFQIEHHLYPSMPQFRHPTISPRVRALLEKHNLPYIQRSYIDAMRVTFANLHKVGMDVFYG